jgi:hypothetical protein
VNILRRLFGGTRPDADEAVDADPAEVEAAERQYELDLLRGEQQRLDELQQRQLRYERHAWEPPAEGGERRADDETKST